MRPSISDIINKVNEVNGVREDIKAGDIFSERYNIGTIDSYRFWKVIDFNPSERNVKVRQVSSKIVSGDKHRGKLVCIPNKFLKEERLGKIGGIQGNCTIDFGNNNIAYKLNNINREFTYSH